MNRVVFKNKIKKIALQKQPIFMLIWEVIWQARDFLLSKELHDLTISLFHLSLSFLAQSIIILFLCF